MKLLTDGDNLMFEQKNATFSQWNKYTTTMGLLLQAYKNNVNYKIFSLHFLFSKLSIEMFLSKVFC